jgi:hypothetical protein
MVLRASQSGLSAAKNTVIEHILQVTWQVTTCELTVSFNHYTAQYNTYHMLYVDDIASDHIRLRLMFVSILSRELKQIWIFIWNCSILNNFIITML